MMKVGDAHCEGRLHAFGIRFPHTRTMSHGEKTRKLETFKIQN